MRSRQHRQPDRVRVLLDHRRDDLLRSLVQPGVDDLDPGVAQRARHDLRPTVVAVQAGFGDDHPDRRRRGRVPTVRECRPSHVVHGLRLARCVRRVRA